MMTWPPWWGRPRRQAGLRQHPPVPARRAAGGAAVAVMRRAGRGPGPAPAAGPYPVGNPPTHGLPGVALGSGPPKPRDAPPAPPPRAKGPGRRALAAHRSRRDYRRRHRRRRPVGPGHRPSLAEHALSRPGRNPAPRRPGGPRPPWHPAQPLPAGGRAGRPLLLQIAALYVLPLSGLLCTHAVRGGRPGCCAVLRWPWSTSLHALDGVLRPRRHGDCLEDRCSRSRHSDVSARNLVYDRAVADPVLVLAASLQTPYSVIVACSLARIDGVGSGRPGLWSEPRRRAERASGRRPSGCPKKATGSARLSL